MSRISVKVNFTRDTVSTCVVDTSIEGCENGEHIIELFALCKSGNFNIHIWVWFGYFIC